MVGNIPETRNKAFLSAWWMGVTAGRNGEPSSANPYPDHRGSYHENNTWSRAFRGFWERGRQEGEKETA
jgi:hypothetical protein